MQALIAAGADVDIQYQRNGELWDTALHIAVFHGQISAGGIAKAMQNLTICMITNYH